jgi:MFS family permease
MIRFSFLPRFAVATVLGAVLAATTVSVETKIVTYRDLSRDRLFGVKILGHHVFDAFSPLAGTGTQPGEVGSFAFGYTVLLFLAGAITGAFLAFIADALARKRTGRFVLAVAMAPIGVLVGGVVFTLVFGYAPLAVIEVSKSFTTLGASVAPAVGILAGLGFVIGILEVASKQRVLNTTRPHPEPE